MASTLNMMPREEIVSLIPQGEMKKLENDTEYLVISNDSKSSENESN
jgi:hypothetical protein